MSSKIDYGFGVTQTAPSVALNPKPVIEGLTQDFEIDLDVLGSNDLFATISDVDVKPGGFVYTNWRGVAPDGNPFDMVGEATLVADPKRIIVRISNKAVVGASGGYAFLSYQTEDPKVNPGTPESLRQFCYVGLRASGKLPVVQVLESHGLVVVKNDVGQNAHIVTAAYQAVQHGDNVELEVRRFRSNGTELSAFRTPLIPGQQFDGEPLEWFVPKAQLNAVDTGGRLEVSYKVQLADGGELEPSRTQVFGVQDAIDSARLLPEPSVDNGGAHDIDPGNYPNGLPVYVGSYPGRAVGDCMVLAWVLPSGEITLKVARLDASSLVAGRFTFVIDHALLSKSMGAVSVYYQYGREGSSLTSKVLALNVVAPREVPPMPTVRGATLNAAPDEYDIDAWDIRRNGAYVLIPAEADLLPGERLEVHWQGEPNGGGRDVIDAPDAEGPRVFNVPVERIAANMSNFASKRFEVFYRIINEATGLYWDSKPLKLLVLPLNETRYTRIKCDAANAAGELVLKPEGALLEQESWIFMAPGQPLSIYLTGVDQGGENFSETLRDSIPITDAEMLAGVVQCPLEYSVLSQIKLNTKFNVWSAVSFDGIQEWGFSKLELALKSSV